MKTIIRLSPRARAPGTAVLALAAASFPAALFAQARIQDAPDIARADGANAAISSPESAIEKWPQGSRDVARVMIEKYGEPGEFSGDALVWKENGAWKRSVVYRTARTRLFGPKDTDYLEQTIGYRVPDVKIAELKRFDPRIQADATSGELSARSESEPMNYLALNLAEEIVSEKRTVDDAREVYRKVTEFYQSGKSSPYLNGFMFTSDTDHLAAPGRFADHDDFYRPRTP